MSSKSPHQRTNNTYFEVEFRVTWVPLCSSHDSHCARVLFQSYVGVIFGPINWPPASQVISMWRFWEDVMRRGGSESVKEHYVPEREFIFISFAVSGVGDTTECTLHTHTHLREAFIILMAACTRGGCIFKRGQAGVILPNTYHWDRTNILPVSVLFRL